MQKKNVWIIAVIVVALVAAGVVVVMQNSDKKDSRSMTMPKQSDSSSQASSSTPAATSSVVIENYAFTPASISVKKGTKVTWTNKDSVKHDVMSDKDGTGPSSDLLAKGESYSYTFDTVGTYTYHCSPHPYMKGTVIVTE